MTPKMKISGPTVLLVEDEQEMMAMYTRLLRRSGFRVVAYSGVDAVLDTMDDRGLRFDLLLTDMDLKGSKLNGFDLILNLRMRTMNQPMILWSGGSNVADVWTGEGGATLILDKGRAADLIGQIKRLLA